VALGQGPLGAAFEFGAELVQVAGDEGVRAGAGLDPAGDVTAPVDGQFYVDLVAGEVASGGLQAGQLVGAGDGL
jgi:hypothetical protein